MRPSTFQVVTVLNELYTRYDQILSQHDCYKVETVNDTYMVVSGLPARNQTKHSAEIASLALNMLMMVEQLPIPHMPHERLLARIGVHTGPCNSLIARLSSGNSACF